MKIFECFIDIQPKPKGRPRVAVKGRFAHAYTDPKTRGYEDDIAEQASYLAAIANLKPSTDTLRVIVRCYIEKAKSNKDKHPTGSRCGDVDNLAKSVLDACNNILWVDDAQILELVVSKAWATDGKKGVSVELFKYEGDVR